MNLVEIFSSYQGEGIHVGRPSVFVRLGGCDLRCSWCDSPGTWRPAARCRIETEPGSGRFDERPNPVPVEVALDAILALGPAPGSFVAVTGGEPLLQPEAVAALARALRGAGLAVYLETDGVLADALARVRDVVDFVSMDWKLASSVRREGDPRSGPVADFHDAHERFLAVALAGGDAVQVKLVLTRETTDAEVDEVCGRLAATGAPPPLVLQPVTPFGRVREAPDAARLLAWLRACQGRLPDVRLIPQTHPVIGAL